MPDESSSRSPSLAERVLSELGVPRNKTAERLFELSATPRSERAETLRETITRVVDEAEGRQRPGGTPEIHLSPNGSMGPSGTGTADERGFWIAISLWGGCLVTLVGAGLFAFFEGHPWYGVGYTGAGVLGIAYMSAYLKGWRRLPSPNLLLAGVLALTWIFFGYNIWLHFKSPVVGGSSANAPIVMSPILGLTDGDKFRLTKSLRDNLVLNGQRLVCHTMSHVKGESKWALNAWGELAEIIGTAGWDLEGGRTAPTFFSPGYQIEVSSSSGAGFTCGYQLSQMLESLHVREHLAINQVTPDLMACEKENPTHGCVLINVGDVR
jgi:hypothetical protein